MTVTITFWNVIGTIGTAVSLVYLMYGIKILKSQGLAATWTFLLSVALFITLALKVLLGA